MKYGRSQKKRSDAVCRLTSDLNKIAQPGFAEKKACSCKKIIIEKVIKIIDNAANAQYGDYTYFTEPLKKRIVDELG